MFKSENTGTSLVFQFPVHIDTAACMPIEVEIEKMMQEVDLPVVFDMAAVNYISSMFIRICIRVAKQKGSENFTLKNVTPEIKRLFKMTGLDEQLQFE
jgi:anti-anti-sigma factor